MFTKQATMIRGLGLDVTTELSLGLPDAQHAWSTTRAEKKRVFLDIIDEDIELKLEPKCGGGASKTQVVGWPPVSSYRKRNNFLDEKDGKETSNTYVKVSMDGTVYLRKIDLSMQKGYSDLALALESLFVCHGIGKALKDEDCSEYMLIYEDKDGDWMLVGDVPWEMFAGSCKRLRIMKRFEGRNDFKSLQTIDFLKRDSSSQDES